MTTPSLDPYSKAQMACRLVCIGHGVSTAVLMRLATDVIVFWVTTLKVLVGVHCRVPVTVVRPQKVLTAAEGGDAIARLGKQAYSPGAAAIIHSESSRFSSRTSITVPCCVPKSSADTL
jgi:hypothetical protein